MEIETKKKPRARRQAAAVKNKAKGPSPAASLLAALKFVAIAQKKAGPTNVQFGHIAHNWAAASAFVNGNKQICEYCAARKNAA